MITKTHLGKPEASLGVNLPGIRELPAVITYNEFGSNTDASIYVADDKEKLILVPVDHTSTISKKPSLYLEKGTISRKTGNVSGLKSRNSITTYVKFPNYCAYWKRQYKNTSVLNRFPT